MIKLHDRFTEEERLSRQQIFSYFTNLSKKNKDKKILEDLEGEEEEETDEDENIETERQTLRNSVIKKLQK